MNPNAAKTSAMTVVVPELVMRLVVTVKVLWSAAYLSVWHIYSTSLSTRLLVFVA